MAGQRSRSDDYDSEKRKIELQEQLLSIQEKRLEIEEKKIQLELRKLELKRSKPSKKKKNSSSRGSRQTAREESPEEVERRGVSSGDEDIISDEDEVVPMYRRQRSNSEDMHQPLAIHSEGSKMRRANFSGRENLSPSFSSESGHSNAADQHQQPVLTEEAKRSMAKNLDAIGGLKEKRRVGRRGSAPNTRVEPDAAASRGLLRKHLSMRDLSTGSHGSRRSGHRGRASNRSPTVDEKPKRDSSLDSRSSEITTKASNMSGQRGRKLESSLSEVINEHEESSSM